MDPYAPLPRDEGGNHRQQDGADDHGGGIVAGELGDKVLRLGLFGRGVLHQVENFGYGGLTKLLGDPNFQQAGEIDAAGQQFPAGGHIPGSGLAGEGGGVQGGGALQHHTVQGNLLAGADHDDLSHRDLVRVYLYDLTIPLHVGAVRTDIHELGDRPPGPAHGIALEQLSHLVKQHDADGLGIFPQHQRADGGDTHEKVLVKNLPMGDIAYRFPQNIPADDKIGDQKQWADRGWKIRSPRWG